MRINLIIVRRQQSDMHNHMTRAYLLAKGKDIHQSVAYRNDASQSIELIGVCCFRPIVWNEL